MASTIHIDPEKVVQALEYISADEQLRTQFIALCREADSRIKIAGAITREDISGPLLDVLLKDKVFQKQLANGTVFEMCYTGKISRDFILSPDAQPDHVWEPQTTKLLLHLSKKAIQVIVGGAYIGDHAILIAKKIHSNGGICHVFEPDANSFQYLQRNAELNQLNNLQFNNIGLWSHETNIRLIGDDSHAYPEETGGSSNGIKATSIDAYCKEKRIECIDLIMLDMEGGEFPSLKGGEFFLKQSVESAPVIIFEIHRHYVDWSNGLEETPVVSYLQSMGYHLYAIRDFQSNYPMKDKPVELIPLNSVYLEGPPHGFNLIAFNDQRLTEDLLFKFVTGVSPKLLLHKDPNLHHPVDGL